MNGADNSQLALHTTHGRKLTHCKRTVRRAVAKGAAASRARSRRTRGEGQSAEARAGWAQAAANKTEERAAAGAPPYRLLYEVRAWRRSEEALQPPAGVGGGADAARGRQRDGLYFGVWRHRSMATSLPKCHLSPTCAQPVAKARRGGKRVYFGSFATAEEVALCVARTPTGQPKRHTFSVGAVQK